MSAHFQTIAGPTRSLYKDRGSKFIGHAFPVEDVSDVQQALSELRRQHPAARHLCYAYLLGESGDEFRANDDGEPSGSAGLPILNQIKGHGLTNVLVVVVRYFGGTKLGVPGLIKAYKEAAHTALEHAKVVTRVPQTKLSLQFPHSRIGDVERILRMNGYRIIDQTFGLECIWRISCPRSEAAACKASFRPFSDVSVSEIQ